MIIKVHPGVAALRMADCKAMADFSKDAPKDARPDVNFPAADSRPRLVRITVAPNCTFTTLSTRLRGYAHRN